MICTNCKIAADYDRQDMHCNDRGCSCQHQPLGGDVINLERRNIVTVSLGPSDGSG